MPNEKSTTPPVTPLASIAGKVKDAVAAKNGGYGYHAAESYGALQRRPSAAPAAPAERMARATS
jgi:hypothetical protein